MPHCGGQCLHPRRPPPPRISELGRIRPRGAPPPPPFGKSCIRPCGKHRQAKKKGLQQEKEKKDPPKDPHRERGALESAGPIAYATFAARLIRHCNEVTLLNLPRPNFLFKIRPYKLGRHPLQGLRPGAMQGPLRPPPSITIIPNNSTCLVITIVIG